MHPNKIRQQLEKGSVVECKCHGNSMTPILKNKDRVVIIPSNTANIGDIVFCRVRGYYYDHLVTAKNKKRGYQISNNHGHVNGWTKQIFGIVIKCRRKYER